MSNFDRIAPYYDPLKRIVFGTAILESQRDSLARISSIADGAKILILGGGTGELLPELLSGDVSSEVCYVEESSKMICLARDRVNDDRRVTFIHGGENDIPEGTFDVIITPFVLDLFSHSRLELTVDNLKRRLHKKGWWLAADFVDGGKWWQRAMLSLMYFFFRLTAGVKVRKLPRWLAILESRGFRVVHRRSFYSGFIASVVLQASGGDRK